MTQPITEVNDSCEQGWMPATLEEVHSFSSEVYHENHIAGNCMLFGGAFLIWYALHSIKSGKASKTLDNEVQQLGGGND